MEILAKEHGILPGSDCTKALGRLLSSLSEGDEEKTLIFEKGCYHLNRADSAYVYRAITNTSAKEEYSDKALVNMHYTPFLFENIKNLTIEGAGSTFIIDGKVTNAIISSCENLTLKNFTTKTLMPNMHKLTVLSAAQLYADFSLSTDSAYAKDSGSYYWYGNGYKLGFFENKERAFWTAGIKPSDENRIFRTAHPFMGAVKIEERSPYVFRVYYLLPKAFKSGQTFYVFDAHRSDAGIFVEKSKNISLYNLTQNFNYSLAFAAQDSENLTVEDCRFVPPENSGIQLASLADFMQICMCAGTISIRNNYFDGAADDALNVHGIYFSVDSVNGKKITLSFRHPQSWGFNTLHKGDRIEFINPKTLLSVDENLITGSEMKDDYHIELTLEKKVSQSYTSYVIEDTVRCPELIFENNTLNRIITRGILYTSRGKCIIRSNRFISNSMSGILLSDNANNWYESGMCRNVTIENNLFEYCGETPVLIKPENRVYGGAVHSSISITNNVFENYKGYCICAQSSSELTISGNTFAGGKSVKTTNCTNVKCDCAR